MNVAGAATEARRFVGSVRGTSVTASVPVLTFALVGALLAFPKLPFVSYSVVGVAVQAGQFAVVTISLVMLTGWVGQISLGHAALVGIGAYATGWAIGGIGLPFPVNTLFAGATAALFAAVLGGVALRVRGLYLAVATLIFSWMADAFLFRIESLTRHASIDVDVVGNPDSFPHFDLGDRTTMFYVTWGLVVVVCFLAANVRDSRTGRAFFALRGSEIGASSLGIDVTRYKLLAFTCSGFLAGVSGSLLMLDSQSLSTDTFKFTASLFYLSIAVVGGLQSLGGALASSALFAGLNEVFFRFPALGEQLDLVSAMLLAAVLLVYRGGLAAVPASVSYGVERLRSLAARHRPAFFERFRAASDELIEAERMTLLGAGRSLAGRLRRRGESSEKGGSDGDGGEAPTESTSRRRLVRKLFRRERPIERFSVRPPTVVDEDGNLVAVEADEPDGPTDGQSDTHVADDLGIALDARRLQVVLPKRRDERLPLLVAEGVTVQFGGLTAVKEASLRVHEHEIVGLIGPNGAGKTTLFNAIAGLNSPTAGTITMFDRDVTGMAVHQRAQLGVARTFQAIQLFPQLDVFANLLVATHVHNPTGIFSHAFGGDRSVSAEREMRERVAGVIDALGLHDVAHRRVADLPFGVLRRVELARAMVTSFPLIMLDEPASGLDNNETDRFASMLLEIRRHGVTLLLIEHDVRMVTSVSDYMYVIDRGEIIAEGPPAQVQRDPAVLAAYLGQPTGEASDAPREALVVGA